MPYPKADLVLRGGPIFRSLQSDNVDALAVWSGRVLAGGRADEMEPLIGPDTRVVELRGRSAVPGFRSDERLYLVSAAARQHASRPYGERVDAIALLCKRRVKNDDRRSGQYAQVDLSRCRCSACYLTTEAWLSHHFPPRFGASAGATGDAAISSCKTLLRLRVSAWRPRRPDNLPH